MSDNTNTPHGCWDCKHAEVEGDRPTAFKPGTTYRTRCLLQAGATATATMAADQGILLPICRIGQWTSLDGSSNAIAIVTDMVTWMIQWNRLYEVRSVLEAQLPGRDPLFYQNMIEGALRFGVASGAFEDYWARAARNILLPLEGVPV